MVCIWQHLKQSIFLEIYLSQTRGAFTKDFTTVHPQTRYSASEGNLVECFATEFTTVLHNRLYCSKSLRYDKPEAPANRWVPPVFYGVVRASGHELGDFGPLVAVNLLCVEDRLVLLRMYGCVYICMFFFSAHLLLWTFLRRGLPCSPTYVWVCVYMYLHTCMCICACECIHIFHDTAFVQGPFF